MTPRGWDAGFVINQTRRDSLPMANQQAPGLVTYDAKDPDTSFPPIEPLRPPEGAPNVLIVLIDDCGFGASSAFGGPCNTPTAERLAADGLKYNRFHTTALCSPTRQAMLTGRNHHSVGMGGITEIATSAPGYSSIRPKEAAPLAETLKLNGYSTAQFGKCHEVPVWETSPMGPFDAWPSGGGGFEHFYGFIGGETNQYAPAIYDGTVPVEPDRTPEEGYHFTEDMTNRTIDWIRQQKALMPDKPFFTYYAPGATHAPHHVPIEWSAKYKGDFDDGWDALRERTLARQKELGVIPEDAELSARPEEIPSWDEMPDELKPVLARQMEVFAGFLEHTDHHIGRVIDALEELEVLDDTLIYYIVGDNGASGEGTPNGTFNELMSLNGAAALETPEFMAERIDKFGTPEAYNHYAVGWAHAMDTPYQWTKQVASHWGGTRNGTIVHWPAGIKSKGEVRAQFSHVIDVASTVLDVAGIPAPTFVHGVQQMPLHGKSMAPTFDDAVLRDVRQPRHLPQGLDRSDAPQHSLGDGNGAPRLRRRRLGALRPGGLDPVERSGLRAAGEAGRAAEALPDRSDPLQRPAARRSPGRALQLGHGRPPSVDPRQLAVAVRRDGAPLGELGDRAQEQVPLGHGVDRGSRGRG
jgi:arylsulfatase A-like enzyme